jgi:hypothetical protein
MTTSVALPSSEARNPFANVARFIPGVLLLGVIGFAGKILEQSINGYAKAHHLVIGSKDGETVENNFSLLTADGKV